MRARSQPQQQAPAALPARPGGHRSPEPRYRASGQEQESAPSSHAAIKPSKLRWDGSLYVAHTREGGKGKKKNHTWIVLTCSHLPAEATLCKTECLRIREIRELSREEGLQQPLDAGRERWLLPSRNMSKASAQLHGRQSQRITLCQLFPGPKLPDALRGLLMLFARSSLIPFTPPVLLCSPSALHMKY